MQAAKNSGAALAAGALVINAFVWGVSWWPLRQLQGFGAPLMPINGVVGMLLKIR